MTVLLALTTADDVFRSVGQNMDKSVDSRGMMALGSIVIGVVIVLFLATRRQAKRAAPTTMNNAGKLVKEIQKKIGLRPAELRQLKAMAEQEQLENPLVLMLCPSVLQYAADKRRNALNQTKARG